MHRWNVVVCVDCYAELLCSMLGDRLHLFLRDFVARKEHSFRSPISEMLALG